MCNRCRQLNVAHALAANLSQSDLNATLLANYAAMLEALVLTAKTLVVFIGPKDLGTKKTVSLGLKRPIINGLWLLYFTKRPGTDHLR